VNGKILYGVARFIAALLRGDETMEVWDITQKENINEQVSGRDRSDFHDATDEEIPAADRQAEIDRLTALGIIDGEKKEINPEEPTGDEYGQFTPKEIVIMNYIAKKYNQDELHKISQESVLWGKEETKWKDVMKLFSIPTDTIEKHTYSSRYAKWAYENWREAAKYNMDFGKIPNPLKTRLKWYFVGMEESGSQIEYKSGETEIMGYDEDDAEDRAMDDFYEWGGEMEVDDWGDYEAYDSQVNSVNFERMAEAKKDEIDEDLENWGYDDEEIGVVKEQVMMKAGDMLKSDIFKFLSNRFSLTPTEHGDIKDTQGNYYRLIDMEEPEDYVTLSHLIDPVVEFVNYGVQSGTFEEGDIQKGMEAITQWLSLAMNQKIDYIN